MTAAAANVEELTPPEGVALHFGIAGVGARLGAVVVDILITVGAAIAFIVLASVIGYSLGFGEGFWSLLVIAGALLMLAVRAPYYIITELLWNGQTLGKRTCRIRVVSADGRSLTPRQIVVRNLMREIELFVPGTLLLAGSEDWVSSIILLVWICGVIAVPLFNRRRQRLGDIIANTYVIEQPYAALMPELASEATTGQRFTFLPHHLDHYGAYELQVLETLLNQGQTTVGPEGYRRRLAELSAVGARIRQKIDFTDRVTEREEEEFLRDFYTAQRGYLEQKRLFGDVRKDKHHEDGERS